MYSAQDHLIILTMLNISMTFVLSLTQMLVFLSLYVMLNLLHSTLGSAAVGVLCTCLVSAQAIILCACWQPQELYIIMSLQADRNVALEEIPVFDAAWPDI